MFVFALISLLAFLLGVVEGAIFPGPMSVESSFAKCWAYDVHDFVNRLQSTFVSIILSWWFGVILGILSIPLSLLVVFGDSVDWFISVEVGCCICFECPCVALLKLLESPRFRDEM